MKLLNPWELLLIVFVLVLIFGSKRLPQMGRSMGGAIKGFKDSVTNRIEEQDADHDQQVAQQQTQLPPAQPVPPPQQVQPAQPVAVEPQVDPRERDTVL